MGAGKRPGWIDGWGAGCDQRVANRHAALRGLARRLCHPPATKMRANCLVDAAGLERARHMIGAGLEATSFNVIRSYIFGDALAERAGYTPLSGMPTYGGYAVGYHLVQAFMQRTGTTIEETTFIPAAEIVAGSGIFAHK